MRTPLVRSAAMSHLSDRATIIGPGYVGLVTAVGLATLGRRVLLVEARADRLDALRVGRSSMHEPVIQRAHRIARIGLSDGRWRPG